MSENEFISGVEIAPRVRVPDAVLRFSFSSSSGPGGQNVNKRATKCELRVRIDDLPIHPEARERLAHSASHLVTASGELIIEADDQRTQERNRGSCLERLRELVVHAMVRPKVRKKTKPSRGARERRIQEKKTRSGIKKNRGERFD